MGRFRGSACPGGAIALLIYYGFGTAIFAGYLLSGRSVVRPRLLQTRLRWPLFYDIFRVGALSSLISLMTNVTIALTTGLVAAFGAAAIAGYGIGTRLEYMLVPLSFGFGGALVALVGTNIGAGNRERALRAAWIGGWVSFALTETHRPVGGDFSGRVAVAVRQRSGGDRGRHRLSPRGRPVLRVLRARHGALFRLAGRGRADLAAARRACCAWSIAVGGGWLMLRMTGNLTLVFAALAVALAVFGTVIAIAVARGAWFRGANDIARGSG